MKFSIIIPLYNKEEHIGTTIKSIMSQTYDNLEVIIVNDASTDNSFEIVSELIRNDKRFLIINNPKNYGVSETRNIGLQMSNGEYLFFLDADDELIDFNFFSDISIFFKKHAIDYLVTTRKYDNRKKPELTRVVEAIEKIDGFYYSVKDKICFVIEGEFPFGGSGSAVISSKIVNEDKKFRNLIVYEDHDFFLPLFLENKVVYYAKSIIAINSSKNSLSKKKQILNVLRVRKHPLLTYLNKSNAKYKSIRKEFFWKYYIELLKKQESLFRNLILSVILSIDIAKNMVGIRNLRSKISKVRKHL